jgi:hypothetical protein
MSRIEGHLGERFARSIFSSTPCFSKFGSIRWQASLSRGIQVSRGPSGARPIGHNCRFRPKVLQFLNFIDNNFQVLAVLGRVVTEMFPHLPGKAADDHEGIFDFMS